MNSPRTILMLMTAISLALAASTLIGCTASNTRLHHKLKHPADQPILNGHAPSPVRVMWFGVASLYITDGETAILIDPYITRPNLLTTLLGELKIDEPKVNGWYDRFRELDPHAQIKAVLVSHSHHDHAMDAPAFAMRSEATITGSPSTLNLASGAGMPSTQMDDIESSMRDDRAIFCYGKFKVTFLRSHHGRALFGRVPLPGTIDQPILAPLRLSDYRVGQTYSILIEHGDRSDSKASTPTPSPALLHHASASWKRGVLEAPDVTADVVFLGLAGTDTYDIYTRQVVDAVEATTVVPFHYDNALRPLDQPFQVFIPVKFQKFVDTIEHNDEFDHLTLRVLEWKQLYSLTPTP